ncbi:hypothetical protein ACFSM5_07850 [Lacibacterium aquatile]|uniref:Uncharacterized protein n=1 Tax=Lacibacterium aquatile TaxID=1168082 RepID=A0ABW5DNU8_9PROT
MSYESIRLRFAMPQSKPPGILSMESRFIRGAEAFQIQDFSYEAMPGTTETDRLVSSVLAAGIGSRSMMGGVLVDISVIGDTRNDEAVWANILPIIGANETAIAEARQSITALLKESCYQRPAALAAGPFCRVLAAYRLMVVLLTRMGYLTPQQQDYTMLELEAALLFDPIKGL